MATPKRTTYVEPKGYFNAAMKRTEKRIDRETAANAKKQNTGKKK